MVELIQSLDSVLFLYYICNIGIQFGYEGSLCQILHEWYRQASSCMRHQPSGTDRPAHTWGVSRVVQTGQLMREASAEWYRQASSCMRRQPSGTDRPAHAWGVSRVVQTGQLMHEASAEWYRQASSCMRRQPSGTDRPAHAWGVSRVVQTGQLMHEASAEWYRQASSCMRHQPSGTDTPAHAWGISRVHEWRLSVSWVQDLTVRAQVTKLDFFFNSKSTWKRCENHTINRAAFVCLSVCLFVPYLLRGPLTDLRQTWWVYVGGPRNCPWGVLFRKGQRLDGSTGHFHFPLYYICASLTPHSCKRRLCCYCI